jgi:hypothetical protein
MTPPLSLKLDEVAKVLNMTPEQFIRRRPRMQAQFHFPRALPGCGPIWSAAQVEAWINAGGVPAEPGPARKTAIKSLVEQARHNLEARYAGIGDDE